MEVKTAEDLFKDIGFELADSPTSDYARYYQKIEEKLVFVVSFMNSGRTVMSKYFVKDQGKIRRFKDLPIDPYLLRAINAQFAELGWIA